MLRVSRLALLLAGAVVATACDGSDTAVGRDLHAQRVVIQREVEGLREVVQRLERGDPMLPLDDLSIAVEDTLVRDLIAAQLPVALDVNRFHIDLATADVQFRGSPVVRLRGRLQVRDQPSLAAAVTLIGALADIRVDPASSVLLARVAADHLAIDDVTSIGQLVPTAVLADIATRVRLELADQLPEIRIPVKVQQEIAFPAVTEGPVRLAGARLPLDVAVSQVLAARGRLWVSVRVRPGEVVRLAEAPDVGESSAADAGARLDEATPRRSPPAAPTGRRR